MGAEVDGGGSDGGEESGGELAGVEAVLFEEGEVMARQGREPGRRCAEVFRGELAG